MYALVNRSLYHFQQIRQSAVTTVMTEKAQGELSDDLKQALEEAQATPTQTEQLEQFIQSQTQELKEFIKDSVAKGAHEVIEQVGMKLQKEFSKQSQQSQNVS